MTTMLRVGSLKLVKGLLISATKVFGHSLVILTFAFHLQSLYTVAIRLDNYEIGLL